MTTIPNIACLFKLTELTHLWFVLTEQPCAKLNCLEVIVTQPKCFSVSVHQT